MIICAFENSPSIPSFLVTKIVYIEYGQLQNDSFSFYLSIAVLLQQGSPNQAKWAKLSPYIG
jgi:hypothetical protein